MAHPGTWHGRPAAGDPPLLRIHRDGLVPRTELHDFMLDLLGGATEPGLHRD